MRINASFFSVCLFAMAMSTAVASADKAAFLPSGRVALGVNYWASHAATRMWTEWDQVVVEQDLKALSENGIEILRVFPNWADFQPIHACFLSGGNYNVVNETRMFDSEEPLPDTPCGRAGVDERMVERFEAFCDLAEKYGLKLVVPLLTGQMTFRNYIPPALANRNPFSDPYALKWEGRYLECMVTRLKAKRAIVAWESGNEARVLGKSENACHSEAWLRYVHQTIRCADPSRPVIGVDGLVLSPDAAWPTSVNAALSDYTTTHPYSFWGPSYNDDIISPRSLTFAAAQTLALEQVGGKPAFIEEHSLRRQEQASQPHVADYLRGMLWNAWSADNKAMLWWSAFDQTGLAFPPYDWSQPCVELGVFKRDRTPYPAVKSIRDFAGLQRAVPSLPKARSDAVVIASDGEIVNSAYILARQAGIFPRFATPEQKLPEASCYFLPDARGRAFVTLTRWEELKAKVREGATLYLSWNDTYLDSLEDVAGIEIDFRQKASGTDLCDFGDFKLECPFSVKRRFKALSAEILARNRDGEGVFFRNRYGKGIVYVFAHNFERTFYQGAGHFEGDGWKVWARICPVSRLLTTAEKDVFVSEHWQSDNRCMLLLVNNSSKAYQGVPTIAQGWRVESFHTDSPSNAAWDSPSLKLSPSSGVLLTLIRGDRP